MTEMITVDLVRLDASFGDGKEAVIQGLAQIAADAGRTADSDQLVSDALAREATSPTGLPGGIAIPHCRTGAVDVPTLVFSRLAPGVDFGAKDGPADLAFLIAAPSGGDATHLQVLTKLARALVRREFTESLRSASSAEEVVSLISKVVAEPRNTESPADPATAAPASETGADDSVAMITPPLVRLDQSLGSDKDAVIRSLAGIVSDAGRTDEPEILIADAFEREQTAATGLPGGIAIPHCRTTAVDVPTLAFARLLPKVDFGAKDGPADLAFLIAAPAGGDATHLQVLTKLARALVKSEFTARLREAGDADEVVELINAVVGPAPKPTPTADPSGPTPSDASVAVGSSRDSAETAAVAPASADDEPGTSINRRRSIVAVTACPTGIAHTYMAAEALEAAAERAGVDIHVETQGSAGSTPLETSIIRGADAAIFAADVGVRERARFAGLPLVNSGVKRAIDEGDQMIREALAHADDPNGPRVEGSADSGGGESSGGGSGSDETWGGRTRRVLMTGVSYMIPFVAAGGLLIALGFLLGGYEIANNNAYGQIAVDHSLGDLPATGDYGLEHVPFDSGLLAYLGALFFILGKTAFMFFIPALAGYIAYAIADRPGIAPGFVMGGLAMNIFAVANAAETPEGLPATGFIGAIVGGVLAGVIAHWVAGWKVPAWARGLMPVLVIPLFTSIVAGLLMLLVFGRPIAWLMEQLTDGLNSMSGSNAILLGVILGLMMAFDMGGPLNKVAYSFAVAGVGTAAAGAADSPELKIMAAVMLAGMVPPIALALATVVRPGLFSAPERENGKAGWLLGASFITEGAIPFAAADPLRVIPAMMLGSAVTGGMAQALDVAVRAPHGGIFVIFAVHNVLGYILALAVGTVVGAIAVVVLKSLGRTPTNVESMSV